MMDDDGSVGARKAVFKPDTSPYNVERNVKNAILTICSDTHQTIHTLSHRMKIDEKVISYVIKRFRPDFCFLDPSLKLCLSVPKTFQIDCIILPTKEDTFRFGYSDSKRTWTLVFTHAGREPLAEIIFSASINYSESTMQDLATRALKAIRDAHIPPITDDEFYTFHKVCPKCSKRPSVMTMLGVGCRENGDYWDDMNHTTCNCGWAGDCIDLLPDIDHKWWGGF